VVEAPSPRINGWLLLLGVLLVVWQPVNVGLAAAAALAALPLRGWPLAGVLLLRLAVTALGLGAGLALIHQRSGAIRFAKIALVASAFTDLFVYSTPYLPNNRLPGDTPIFVAISLAYHAAWLTYLFRSRRVRALS
jgi:hypothetical protein